MKHIFSETLKTYAPVPDEQIHKYLFLSKQEQFTKGRCFLRAGDIPLKLGFNLKGLFRYYYIDRKGNEFTKAFVPEGRFVASYSAMAQAQESYFSIEALEDSHLIVIDYKDWQVLAESHPCWARVLQAQLERAFIFKEKREKEFLLDDAMTRYLSFLKDFEPIQHRIKQYLIASYLGITPVALSRIRKRIGNVNLG